MSTVAIGEATALGYARNRETSKAAASAARVTAAVMRIRVFCEIENRGTHGATADELSAQFDVPHNSIAPRCTELAQRARIIDSGQRRLTRQGRRAIVWVIAKVPEAA